MDDEQDRDIVILLADRLLAIFKIQSWSFDKGYWRKENKELLQMEVPQVIMPKLGKRCFGFIPFWGNHKSDNKPGNTHHPLNGNSYSTIGISY